MFYLLTKLYVGQTQPPEIRLHNSLENYRMAITLFIQVYIIKTSFSVRIKSNINKIVM